MILSDLELKAELEGGKPENGVRDERRLIIDPMPPDDRISPSSVDLTLGNVILLLPSQASSGVLIKPNQTEFDIDDLVKRYAEKKDLSKKPFTLNRHQFVHGDTAERIQLPLHLGARIEGKSTLARLGIFVHATAPTVQPGFNGTLRLEISSVGPFPIILEAGMEIAQLIVERVGLPAVDPYSGRFQNQGTT